MPVPDDWFEGPPAGGRVQGADAMSAFMAGFRA